MIRTASQRLECSLLALWQNGTHCGSYDSFDIAAVAWEQPSRASLP